MWSPTDAAASPAKIGSEELRALCWGFCKPSERYRFFLMSGGCRRCAYCGPESLPDGAARREQGECEGGGLRGIDETVFESYVACTNCKRIFGISCINSMHEAVREAAEAAAEVATAGA